jgi:Mg2+ and Co2+ transporter CorA
LHSSLIQISQPQQESRKRQERIAKLNALKKRDRVRVVIGNVFIFLFKDGTVISIHSRDRSFGNQIYQRLVHSDTVLRKDPDPSLLVHAIVDLTVDQALLVVDKYSDKIAEIETNILLKPRMDAVRGCMFALQFF